MDDVIFSLDGDQAHLEARRLFQKTLAGWAFDVLNLRKAGLDQPTFRLFEDDDLSDESWPLAA